MKILIFSGYFYPHKGGVEDYVYILAKGLIKNGFDVIILTNNTEKISCFEIKNKIKIYRLDCYNLLNNKYPVPKLSLNNAKIFRFILKENLNFINTHTRFWITSFLGFLISKIKRVPLIHVEHGSCHTETNSRIVSFFNKVFDHTCGSLIVKNATLRIGVSDAALKFMEHLGKKGDLKISKGIDFKKFSVFKNKNKLKILKKLNLNKKFFFITSIGRLIYAKGFQDLITAVSYLEKETKEKIKILIVGDGEYKKELEFIAERFYLRDKIIFFGEKENKEVIEILNISDIFVNPSYSEGLPTTVLEAGILGIPVIATNVGGTSEIIKNYENGILINPKSPYEIAKSIEFMIKSKKERIRFGKNLREFIKKNYSYDEMINKFLNVYKDFKNEN